MNNAQAKDNYNLHHKKDDHIYSHDIDCERHLELVNSKQPPYQNSQINQQIENNNLADDPFVVQQEPLSDEFLMNQNNFFPQKFTQMDIEQLESENQKAKEKLMQRVEENAKREHQER